MFSMLLEEAEKEAEDEPVLRSNYRYVVLCRYKKARDQALDM